MTVEMRTYTYTLKHTIHTDIYKKKQTLEACAGTNINLNC